VAAEAIVAVAEQVKEVCLVMQLPSFGSPTLLHCPGSLSACPDVPFIRPACGFDIPTMLCLFETSRYSD
jgi:hypothetical protein